MKSRAVMILGLAFVLAACGNKADEDAAAAGATSSTAGGAAAQPGASEAATAVLQSEGSPLARLSFVLESRPVVRQPFSIKLLVTGVVPVPALQVVAEAPGFVIAPASSVLALPTADTAVSHGLTATAQQEGLAQLTVRLKVEGGTEAVYAIPLLISGAEAETTPAPAPTPGG